MEEITFLTNKFFKDKNVVLPHEYEIQFIKNAKKFNVDIKDTIIFEEYLQKKENQINHIMEETNINLNKIHKNTIEAQKYIIKKDDKKLSSINEELNKMKNEIILLQNELYTDPLTKSLNRKWLSEKFLDNNKFNNKGFFVFLDLNDFKSLNDSFGHLIGDQVLSYFVKFLEKEFNNGISNIVRYAGDEFIILINNNTDNYFFDKVDKEIKEKQKILKNTKLGNKEHKNISFSFSYGISQFKKNDDFDIIFEEADKNMYINKDDK